jgi:thioredoxin reductase
VAGGSPATAVSAEDEARLTAAGVAIERRPIAALRGAGADLDALELAEGGELPCGGVLVGATLHQRSGLAAALGLAFAPPGPMTGEAVEIDGRHRTSVPGIFAAGDITPGPPSVSRAVAHGTLSAATIVGELTGAV